MRRIIPIVFALVLVVSVRTSAQEMPAAEKWENVEWSTILSWQFVGAQADTAMTIMFDIMMPAAREAIPGLRCFRHITGEWHATCIAPMPEGPAYLEWAFAPDFRAFVIAVIEQQGEAATGIFDTFEAATARETSTIVLEPTGGM